MDASQPYHEAEKRQHNIVPIWFVLSEALEGDTICRAFEVFNA